MRRLSMTCPHVKDGLCMVSTDLANHPVLLAEDACKVCSRLPVPQWINKVTLSKAISTIRNSNPAFHDQLIYQLKEIEYPFLIKGPGSELKKLISWFPVNGTKKCKSCRLLEIRMNKWGIETCIAKKDFILRKLHIAALRRKIPFSRRLVEILIDKAIKKCESL